MNLLNRIIIILLILAAMILIPLILIFPEQAQIALRNAADILQANIDWLNGLTPTAQLGMRLLLSAMGMAAFLIGLLFLVLEVIRIRRTTARLKDGSGELMINGIAGYLSYYIDLLPDVLHVKPSVQSAGKSVRAAIYVETAPGISILEKSQEIRKTAQQVLQEQLGLQVKGEIKVTIKPVSYPKASRGRRSRAVAKPIVQPLLSEDKETGQQEPVEVSEQKEIDTDASESTAQDNEVIEVKAPPESDA